MKQLKNLRNRVSFYIFAPISWNIEYQRLKSIKNVPKKRRLLEEKSKQIRKKLEKIKSWNVHESRAQVNT